ncbi:ABC transporter permease [Massilia sp. W12]|uniref:ABC transporter permease n=1 Tax=Massilia sp. W12 TaxID=3126507 RepID=UPI0030CE3E8C
MFRQFLLRCYRSFSRNIVVSILPLAMPMIFLLLFLDATKGAGAPPSFRIGVAQEAASSPWVDELMAKGVVRIDTLTSEAKADTIDSRKHDAILLAPDKTGVPVLMVREGLMPWARVLTADKLVNSAEGGATARPRIDIREIKVSNNDYLSFILPGLFVMVLIQLAMTSTANVVLNDRADGTFRLVSSVKGAILPLVAAEILFRLIFACVCYCLMLLAISQSTTGWINSTIFPFTAVFMLGAVMMVVFGYTLGGLLPGRRNWTAVITLMGLAFWFFSDILFPASQHALARPLALVLPPTYLTDALRQIATGKPGTFPLYVDIGAMVFVLVVSTVISIRYFRFETNDDRL